MFGIARIEVDPDTLKIGTIEIFFDPESFMRTMKGEKDPEELARGQDLIGDVTRTAIEKIERPEQADQANTCSVS